MVNLGFGWFRNISLSARGSKARSGEAAELGGRDIIFFVPTIRKLLITRMLRHLEAVLGA